MTRAAHPYPSVVLATAALACISLVAPHAWGAPHPRFAEVFLSAAEAAQRATPAPAPAQSRARWVWPLSGSPSITREFAAPSHRYGQGHRGVDIAATSGHVLAVESGRVHFAGTVAGRPVVSIRHSDGLLSTYEPVIARVSPGDVVQTGQVIGILADIPHPGCRAPCLHLGARVGAHDYIDPAALLGVRGPSVLYPR